jgi:hypothetical protein
VPADVVKDMQAAFLCSGYQQRLTGGFGRKSRTGGQRACESNAHPTPIEESVTFLFERVGVGVRIDFHGVGLGITSHWNHRIRD